MAFVPSATKYPCELCGDYFTWMEMLVSENPLTHGLVTVSPQTQAPAAGSLEMSELTNQRAAICLTKRGVCPRCVGSASDAMKEAEVAAQLQIFLTNFNETDVQSLTAAQRDVFSTYIQIRMSDLMNPSISLDMRNAEDSSGHHAGQAMVPSELVLPQPNAFLHANNQRGSSGATAEEYR